MPNTRREGRVDLFDRIFQAHRLLRSARRPVSHRALEEKLECSRATVNRILRDMRLFLNAPIEYDRDTKGYRYVASADGPYELPGLWFNSSELYALLTAQKLLEDAQPGLLEEHLAPLRERIEQVLKAKRAVRGDVASRIKILRMNSRRVEPECFRTVAGALLEEHRLAITYHARGSDSTTEREISPQRLVHYRDNWYLDAFDHGKEELRSFSVDRIRKAVAMKKGAKTITAKDLDAHYESSYGIFAGKATNKAVLRFTPERARWVAEECWHPEQVGRFEEGNYVLEVPYSHDHELVMDILKYGPDVTVLAPSALRMKVASLLRGASRIYETR